MEMVSSVSSQGALVSIVIPAFNAQQVIAECLDSVLKQEYATIEVLVIDDCSFDSTFCFVSENYPQVTIMQSHENTGFAASVNLGIQRSKGEIIVLLNMDTVVRPDWLSPLVKVLVADESVGLVGSKILFSDGQTIQHAGGMLRSNGVSLHIGRGAFDAGQFETCRDVEYLCGASLGFRRSLVEELGRFDEGYKPLYYEDADLAFRVRKAGRRVVYVPDSVLIHKENVSTGGLSPHFYYYYHRSRLRFVFKNYPLENIFFGFFKEEKRWFFEELPLAFRGTLLRVYGDGFLKVTFLLFQRMITRFFSKGNDTKDE